MNSAEYFIWRNKQREGPFTIDQLVQMWEDGQLPPRTVLDRNDSTCDDASEWYRYINEAKRTRAVRVDTSGAAAVNIPVHFAKPKRAASITLSFLILPAIFSDASELDTSAHPASGYSHGGKFSADFAARKFVEKSMPGAHVVSSCATAIVFPGATAAVAMRIQSQLPALLEKSVIVEMHKSGSNWICDNVHQESRR